MRLCLEPRCPEPAIYRGRCKGHAVSNERATHPNKQTYNRKRWKTTRRRQLSGQPICEIEGCSSLATDVHHRHDLALGGDAWATDNLQSLCHEHHAQITRRRQAG